MILEYVVVDEGSHGVDKYMKIFINRSAVPCKLLRVGCHLKSHWHQELGL